MKTPNKLITILLVLTCSLSFAQRSVSKKIKIDAISVPIVPVENFETMSFKIYFPSHTVTKDTLRKYAGNMDILKTDEERLKSIKHFSIRPTKMVNDNADIQVIVAFDDPQFLDKSLNTNYYVIKHRLKTKVKILDGNGSLLDHWTEPSDNTIHFGNEQIEYANGQDGFTIRSLAYNEYDNIGETMVNKKAIMRQLKKVIETLYDKIYFTPVTHKFDMASAKGKNHDYTVLDNAFKSALASIETKNYDKLSSNFDVWQSHIDKVVTYNRKTMITPEIAAGLSHNIVISYFLINDLNSAKKAIEASNYPSTYLSDLIDHSIRAQNVNDSIKIPTKDNRFKAIDIKRTIGRKRKNKDLDFLINQNVYGSFGDNDDASEAVTTTSTFSGSVKDALEAMKKADETGIYDYEGSVINTSMQGAMLMLDNFRFSGIVNKPFPKAICELTELDQILASNMKFTELPEDISHLNNLRKFVLKGNNLEFLPDSIGDLSALETLNLSNNKLTTIPESIKNCTNLKTLNLKGNNISASEITKIKTFLPKKCKLKV